MSLSEVRSSIYGPVRSWRFGASLGVDLILHTSTCSFDCIYCQLGSIQQVTDQQRIYVPTVQVLQDLEGVDWSSVDLVTISGSGEPTLALNIGEVIHAVRTRFGKPVTVLTNSTWLWDRATRYRIREADRITCKLDGADEETMRRMNRPTVGVTLDRILAGIAALRADEYSGILALQCMLMPANRRGWDALIALIADIKPDEVHLNTPTRPYPKAWYPESRGNHQGPLPVPSSKLSTITWEEAQEVEQRIHALAPATKIMSVYKEAPKAQSEV